MSASKFISKSKMTLGETEDDKTSKTSEVVDVINVQKQKQRANEGYIDGYDDSDDDSGYYSEEEFSYNSDDLYYGLDLFPLLAQPDVDVDF